MNSKGGIFALKTAAATLLAAAALCLLHFPATAQSTKVRGRVVDAADGSPIPFAAVYFIGTQTGTTTDINGEYTISTRDMTLTEMSARLIGYRPAVASIKPGIFNEQHFFLKSELNELGTVTVKADNRLAKRLLANIEAHREKNNPESRPGYACDVYSKMELDLTHPEEQLRSKAIRKQCAFIFDYVDTSDISGVPYLPVMINESVTRRYHTRSPEVDRERIVANQLSGADPSGNLVSQFTGSMHLKNNFYAPFINAFNVEIPSPTNSSGLLFYNYFIIDSLKVDGRKTYLVRYHPRKSISTPAFDGEMMIDAEDFALRSLKAKVVRGQNVNWVRDLAFEAAWQRLADSTWFYKTDRFYADFSISTADSSKLLSFIGNRTLEFSNPVFDRSEIVKGLGSDTGGRAGNLVDVANDAGLKGSSYWDSVRPYPLSQKEKNIYKMVTAIQDTKLYTTLYDVVYTIINGYWDIGKLGIGPYLKLFSFNPLEGFRMSLGVHTSVDWSKKDRFTGYLAYGVLDKEFKGGLSWEHLFSKTPTRKLTVDAHYDVLQLGRGTNKFNSGNILASVMGAGKTQKLLPVTEFSSLYDHEFAGSFNTAWNIRYREYHGNRFVPLLSPGGDIIATVPSLSASASFRFSHNETVMRGHFIKRYTHTDYPVLTFTLTGGCSQLGKNLSDAGAGTTVEPYLQPEITMSWKFRIPPLGMSKLNINAGTIIGRVPYTMLHLHEGNGTFLMDKSSFSTMDFFEFASDTWATLMWDHNFYGFFLGKIPLLKKLQIREAILLKATWGMLSDRNNGMAQSSTTPQAMLLFPQGMKDIGKVPFVEAGVGLSNILRLFRVDFVWRLTHRDDVRAFSRNFVVNFGIEIKF